MRIPPTSTPPPKDGDGMVIFAALVVLCGTLILWRALDPDNWLPMAEAGNVTSASGQEGCRHWTERGGVATSPERPVRFAPLPRHNGLL